MTQQKSLTLKYYWSTKKQVNDGDCNLVCNHWSNAIYFGVFFFFLSSDEAALPLKQSELTETISSLLGNKSTLPEILCNTLTLTKTLCSAGRVHIKKGNSAFGRLTSAPQLCFLIFFLFVPFSWYNVFSCCYGVITILVWSFCLWFKIFGCFCKLLHVLFFLVFFSNQFHWGLVVFIKFVH